MVLAALGAVLLGAAVLVLVPASVFLIQIVASRPLRGGLPDDGRPRPSVAVLMPAHDEAAGIGAAIAAILPQLGGGDCLLVVADNCSDETAKVAAAAGAQVSERNDPGLRGKGYALDHGVRQLALGPPQVVVVVDADCIVAAGSLAVLARESLRTGRPVQALYLMHAPPGAALKQRIAQFAWAVRNDLRPSGSHRLGWPCQLMGTGMAFPWPLVASARLASSSIVEDMQLGVELAAAGTPPRFCRAALVTSAFPESAAGTLEQRTRWEHGHLSMIASHGAPLFCRGLFGGRPALLAMALDLCVPPLAALVLVLLTLLALSALLALAGGATAPLYVAMVALIATAAAVALAWHRVGRGIVSLREMLRVPGYVLGKIPIYVRLFTARQLQWIRTRRDDGEG